jgi:hypothetical protein
LKESDVGETVTVEGEVTCIVTGMESWLARDPLEVSVTVPLYVDCARVAAGDAVIVSVAGVLPEVGETESHWPPLLVKLVAVKGRIVDPSLVVILTVCVAVPPGDAERVSDAGAESKAGGPTTFSVTGMLTVVPTPNPVSVSVPE